MIVNGFVNLLTGLLTELMICMDFQSFPMVFYDIDGFVQSAERWLTDLLVGLLTDLIIYMNVQCFSIDFYAFH